jgi:Holliday junction resolvase RusA-like endonuclease
MPIPKPIKERSLSTYHATVPYIDNLYRFLIDAIKGILVADDRVICSLIMKKVYDKHPRTEFTITELE